MGRSHRIHYQVYLFLSLVFSIATTTIVPSTNFFSELWCTRNVLWTDCARIIFNTFLKTPCSRGLNLATLRKKSINANEQPNTLDIAAAWYQKNITSTGVGSNPNYKLRIITCNITWCTLVSGIRSADFSSDTYNLQGYRNLRRTLIFNDRCIMFGLWST